MIGKMQQADRLLAEVKMWGMANRRRELVRCVERYLGELRRSQEDNSPTLQDGAEPDSPYRQESRPGTAVLRPAHFCFCKGGG